MGTVVLLRHGETTWNRDGRVQGWADSTLTDRGRRQARAAAEHVAAEYDPDRVVASDLKRTRETVETLRAAGLGVDPTFDRAWRERNFGEYQGLTRTDIATRHATFQPDDSLVAVRSVPNGESRGAFETRVAEGFDQLVADLGPDETALVVTHGGSIRVVCSRVTGRDLPTLAREFSPSNCGITAVDCAPGGSDDSADGGNDSINGGNDPVDGDGSPAASGDVALELRCRNAVGHLQE